MYRKAVTINKRKLYFSGVSLHFYCVRNSQKSLTGIIGITVFRNE